MSDPQELITSLRASQTSQVVTQSATPAAAANAPVVKGPPQTFQERLNQAVESMKGKTVEPAGVVPPAPKPKAEEPPAPEPSAETKGEAPEAVETKPADPPAEAKPVEDVNVRKRLDILLEKERRWEAKKAADKAALEKERAELASFREEKKRLDELKAKAKENPEEWLKAADLDFEKAAKAYIEEKKKPAPTPEEIEERVRLRVLEELKKSQADERAKLAEEERAANLDRIRNYVIQKVQESQAYPILALTNNEHEVYEYAKMVYDQGDANRGFRRGTDLPLEKAAEIVENEARSIYAKRWGAEKLDAILKALGNTPEAEATRPAEAKAGKQTKTLSNDKVSASAAPSDELKNLPKEERLRMAAKLLAGARK